MSSTLKSENFRPMIIDRGLDLGPFGLNTRLLGVVYLNGDRPLLLTVVLSLTAPAANDVATGIFRADPTGPGVPPPATVVAMEGLSHGATVAADTIMFHETATFIVEPFEYYMCAAVTIGTGLVGIMYWYETVL